MISLLHNMVYYAYYLYCMLSESTKTVGLTQRDTSNNHLSNNTTLISRKWSDQSWPDFPISSIITLRFLLDGGSSDREWICLTGAMNDNTVPIYFSHVFAVPICTTRMYNTHCWNINCQEVGISCSVNSHGTYIVQRGRHIFYRAIYKPPSWF